MEDVQHQPCWSRRQALTAAESVWVGLAIGAGAAVFCAFNPPREFSVGYLVLLLLTIGPFGGFAGYWFWFVLEPAREAALRRVTGRVALVALACALVAFPGFWWNALSRSGIAAVLLMGFVCAAAAFVTLAGFGFVHLGTGIVNICCGSTKAGPRSRPGRMWDRELDQG